MNISTNENLADCGFENDNYHSNRLNKGKLYQKQNKNFRNNQNNHVAPLQTLNSNSVPNNDQESPFRRPNNYSKRYNRKKSRNANQRENLININTNSDTLSLQNENVIISTLKTSYSMDSITYQESQAMHSAHKNEPSLETPNKVEDTSNPIHEKSDDLKQLSFDESESSLEFISCCSTPMALNESKSTQNLTVSENVIRSLDFKSNDILAIDYINDLGQSNEENEVTCVDIDLVETNQQNQSIDQEQVSVIETKQIKFNEGENSFETTELDLVGSICPNFIESNSISHEYRNEIKANIGSQQNQMDKNLDYKSNKISTESEIFDYYINQINIINELDRQISEFNLTQCDSTSAHVLIPIENENFLNLTQVTDPIGEENNEINVKIELANIIENELPLNMQQNEADESIVTVLQIQELKMNKMSKIETTVDCLDCFPCSIL